MSLWFGISALALGIVALVLPIAVPNFRAAGGAILASWYGGLIGSIVGFLGVLYATSAQWEATQLGELRQRTLDACSSASAATIELEMIRLQISPVVDLLLRSQPKPSEQELAQSKETLRALKPEIFLRSVERIRFTGRNTTTSIIDVYAKLQRTVSLAERSDLKVEATRVRLADFLKDFVQDSLKTSRAFVDWWEQTECAGFISTMGPGGTSPSGRAQMPDFDRRFGWTNNTGPADWLAKRMDSLRKFQPAPE